MINNWKWKGISKGIRKPKENKILIWRRKRDNEWKGNKKSKGRYLSNDNSSFCLDHLQQQEIDVKDWEEMRRNPKRRAETIRYTVINL